MPQEIAIEKRWEKMLISSTSRNKLPTEYLSISENARIKDSTITKRRGYRTVVSSSIWTENKWITYNKELFVAANSLLNKVDLDAGTLTSLWSIGTDTMVNFINYWKYTIILTWVWKPYVYNGSTLSILWNETYQSAYITSWYKPTKVVATREAVTDGSFNITIDWTARSITWLDFSLVATMDAVCDVIQTWIRTITGSNETVIFNDRNRFVISSSNITSTSAITVTTAQWSWTDISWAGATNFLSCDVWATGEIITAASNIDAPNVDAIIWDKFTWFTFIAGNTADRDNVLYISRPITDVNPERCYDRVWENSETITFDSKILWLKATLNQLFIFTENRVEYIGKDSLQTIWWVATLISTPIGDGGRLASYRSVVTAGNKVFYLTKNKTINTLNYASWTVEPEIGVLTDEPVFKITKYLANLDDDQSNSFGYFDEGTKTIHWFLKTEWALYNDTVLVYDIENATWTTDTKKFFNDAVAYDNKVYTGSSINSDVIQDNVWRDDNATAIEFKIEDTDISLWTIKEKLFQWWQTSWGLNRLTNMDFTTYIDDNASALSSISWEDYFESSEAESPLWAIWWATIWGTAIGWMTWEQEDEVVQFDKILNHSNLYKRWKRIRRRIVENSLGSDFYLDLYTLYADVTWNTELWDTF